MPAQKTRQQATRGTRSSAKTTGKATKKAATKHSRKKASAKKAARKTTAATTRSTKAHSAAKKGGGVRKWSAGVDTESTYPEEGLFKEDAATIARRLASKKVSPKGPASGMRMLTFYINRAGKNLSATGRRELERAKTLLHARVERAKARTA